MSLYAAKMLYFYEFVYNFPVYILQHKKMSRPLCAKRLQLVNNK